MAYETQCGGCIEYDFQGDNVKSYCSWHKVYCYPGDSCSHQTPREQSSGCYLTTIICKLLGYSDDCYPLTVLRDFRDHVMQKDPKYLPLLLEYAVLGPKLSEMIENDPDNNLKDSKEELNHFYCKFIWKTVTLIQEKKYDEAVMKYTDMINCLKEYYGISDLTEEEIRNYSNYDMTQGGHGKVLLKSKVGEI